MRFLKQRDESFSSWKTSSLPDHSSHEASATTSSVVSQSFLKAHALISLLLVVEMLVSLLFTRLVPSTYSALSSCLQLLHP